VQNGLAAGAAESAQPDHGKAPSSHGHPAFLCRELPGGARRKRLRRAGAANRASVVTRLVRGIVNMSVPGRGEESPTPAAPPGSPPLSAASAKDVAGPAYRPFAGRGCSCAATA
jgi:hypothetical protein